MRRGTRRAARGQASERPGGPRSVVQHPNWLINIPFDLFPCITCCQRNIYPPVWWLYDASGPSWSRAARRGVRLSSSPSRASSRFLSRARKPSCYILTYTYIARLEYSGIHVCITTRPATGEHANEQRPHTTHALLLLLLRTVSVYGTHHQSNLGCLDGGL